MVVYAIMVVICMTTIFLFGEGIGWNIDVPTIPIKKNLVMVSSETCMSDSILLLRAALKLKGKVLGSDVYGITKEEAWYLKSPITKFLCIFIKRDKKSKQVDMIVNKLKKCKQPFILYMFPEGSCKPSRWKKGFHFIAKKTNADICIVGIDHATKKVVIDGIFTPRDNPHDNIKIIKTRLRKYTPKRAEWSTLWT